MSRVRGKLSPSGRAIIVVGCSMALASPGCRASMDCNGAKSGHGRVVAESRQDLGTEHPLVLQDGSVRWGWVVACQARRDTDGDGRESIIVDMHGEAFGDELKPFLMTVPGPGQPIDLYLGSSSTKQYVAFLSKKRLILFNAKTRHRIDLSSLGARVWDDGNPTMPHPAVAFEHAGNRLAFVRRGGGGDDVILFDPDSGHEQVVHHASAVWRMEFAKDDKALSVAEPAGDTDHNGKVEPQQLMTSLSSRRCRGPITSWSVWAVRGDEAAVSQVTIPVERPDLVVAASAEQGQGSGALGQRPRGCLGRHRRRSGSSLGRGRLANNLA